MAIENKINSTFSFCLDVLEFKGNVYPNFGLYFLL